MVTDAELAQVMPRLSAAHRAEYLPHLQQAMREFRIEGRLREAAFLAQLAEESIELSAFQEQGGNAYFTRLYEGRAKLGNTQKGDGARFHGRGPIQLTGRFNYAKYGRLLGLDLINHPDLAATPAVGFRIAGLYWQLHDLNSLADRQQFVAITKAINGGTRGLAERQRYYRRGLAILSDRDTPGGVTVVVNGQEISDAGLFRGNASWVPVRATVEALGWHVVSLKPANDQATVSRDGASVDVPFLISAGVGYSPAAELAAATGCIKSWDPDDRTVTLTQETS